MMRTAIRATCVGMVALAFVLPAVAQPAQKQTIVEGKIIRADKDTIVLRTPADKEVTVYATPQTKYVITEKGGTFVDLKPDTQVAVWYDVRDNRWNATRIVGLTQVEGQVVRVEKNTVVVKTAGNKEVIVYVQPTTVYDLTPQGGAITDLRPGSAVNVYYNVEDRQFRAHRIWIPRRK